MLSETLCDKVYLNRDRDLHAMHIYIHSYSSIEHQKGRSIYIYTNLSDDSGPVLQSWWSIDEDNIKFYGYDFTCDKVECKTWFSLQ